MIAKARLLVAPEPEQGVRRGIDVDVQAKPASPPNEVRGDFSD
jgi:hypothetical protein